MASGAPSAAPAPPAQGPHALTKLPDGTAQLLEQLSEQPNLVSHLG